MSEGMEMPDAETSSRSSGPGERLQAARIEQGIALDELAHQMHLSVGILESLENNRFEDMAAPIFVKGYLRSYARIVDLDEGEILDLYVSEYMQGDPPIGSTSNGLAEGGTARKRPGHGRRWLLLLLVLLLAAGGWWYQRSQQSAETLSLDAASENGAEPEIAAAPTPAARQLSNEAGQRLEQLEPVQPEAVEAAPGSMSTEQTSSEPTTAAPVASVNPPESVTNVSGQAPIEQSMEQSDSQTVAPSAKPEAGATEEVTAAVAASEAGETAAPPAQAAPTAGSLQMTVTADTWADIRDARGRKLVYNLIRAGRKLNIDGEPPLKLFFGNGHGVELRWKGRPVDLASRIRADNTVRITLE